MNFNELALQNSADSSSTMVRFQDEGSVTDRPVALSFQVVRKRKFVY